MLNFLRAVINGFTVILIFALLALGIFTIALQIPSVQTFVVQTATERVSKALGYPISIARVNIKWFDVVSLEEISVKDRKNQQMIDVGRMDVNLNVSDIIENASREIHLDEVNVYRPSVHLVVMPGSGSLNIDGFIERISELTAPEHPRPANAPESNTPFTIGKSRITDGTFQYDDPRQRRRKGNRVFDYSHFELKAVHGDLMDFLAQGDTISFVGKNLKMVDSQTGLNVKNLDTRFLFCQKKMELKQLAANIGDSFLKDEIIFRYNRSGDLGDFNHKVLIDGHLTASHISSKDLGLFSEYVDKLNETWKISGRFIGKVDDFVFSDTDLYFGKNSRLTGDLGFKGLPRIEGCEMNIRLSSSRVEPADLIQYYPEWDKHEDLQKFGLTMLDGTFKGTLEDFAVDASASSDLGKIAGDLVFHISDAKSTTYAGAVSTSDFELGILLDDQKTWQKLDFVGKVFGKGLELKFASTNMDAAVKRIGFRNYDYRDITLKGNLQNQYFNGNVIARDSNFVVNLEGEFDLSHEKNAFDVQGTIQKADLRALGYIKDSITLRTELDIKVTGNDIDELIGKARLLNTYLVTTKNERNLVIDTLVFSSVQKQENRTMLLESEFLTARLQGNFLPTQAWGDINKVLQEYQLYFLGNELTRTAYYAAKPFVSIKKNYQIDYEVETKNLSRFLAFISPDIYVSRGAKAEGFFKMDNTSFLTVTATADTTKYGKNLFVKSELDVTTSKFVNSAEVLASVLVTSEQQKMNVLVPTEKLELEGAWDVDHIDFNGGIQQVASTNRANLGGEIRFLPAGLDISFKNSRLSLLDEAWSVPTESLISIAESDISFRNLGLVSGKQRLSLNGTLSNNPDKSVVADIRNFRLGTLNTVLNTKMAGIMDGSARLKDAYNSMILDANFSVEGLGYADYEFGNLSGTGEWDPEAGRIFQNG